MTAKFNGLIIFFCFLSYSGHAQTKLLLTNGKLIPAKFIVGQDSNVVINKYKNKSLFSVIYPDDTEQITFEKSSHEAGKLILFNGRMIPFQKLQIKEEKIYYLMPKVKDKSNNNESLKKYKKRKMEDVFSIKYNDGNEKMVYIPDTAFSGELSQSEMQMFIKGEQDAIAFYNKTLPAIGGFASGIVGSYFAFYSVFLPAIYVTSLGAKTPKIEKIHELNTNANMKLKDTEYVAGFQKKAKDKNIINGSKGALLGLIIGLISMQLLFGK